MYVGRIVVVGKTDKPFVAYRVSSRSFPNRVAEINNNSIAIVPIDPEDIKKNPYIAYNCIRVSNNGVVVSNGSHTDPIFEKLEEGIQPDVALQIVLSEMGYERDELNTPRIAGIIAKDIGYLGIARIDAVEVNSFQLEEDMCGIICTYEMNRIDNKRYPFRADTAFEAAKYVFDSGVFKDLEKPICAAAWMDNFAVYNPHA